MKASYASLHLVLLLSCHNLCVYSSVYSSVLALAGGYIAVCFMCFPEQGDWDHGNSTVPHL